MAMALPLSSSKNPSTPRSKGHSEEFREAKELRLHQLIDITFEKIETMRKYLTAESELLGMDVEDEEVNAVVQRQNHLMNRAISCFNNHSPKISPFKGFNNRDDKRTASGRKHSVSFKMDMDDEEGRSSARFDSQTPTAEEKMHRYNATSCITRVDKINMEREAVQDQRVDSIDGAEFKVDPSWCGSLDRNYGKKKKEAMDRRRRHTKTIGSMAGLDFIKKSHELQPDEQYEIGLPRVTSRSTSKLSTSKNGSMSYPMLPPSWTTDMLTSSKPVVYPPSMPVEQGPSSYTHHHHRQHSGITEIDYPGLPFGTGRNAAMAKELVKARLGTGSGHSPQTINMPFSASDTSQSSKRWFETNLDDSTVIVHLSPLEHSVTGRGSSSGSTTDGFDSALGRLQLSGLINDSQELNDNESGDPWAGFTNESTKPFEMSDYYKYSTKYRPRHGSHQDGNDAASFTPVSTLSPATSLPEDRKNDFMDFFTRKVAEDAAYRHPKPDIPHEILTSTLISSPHGHPKFENRSEESNLSSILNCSSTLETPLSQDRKNNLIEYFTQKAAMNNNELPKCSPLLPCSPIMQTPLSNERKVNLIDYFTRMAAEKNTNQHQNLDNSKNTSADTNFMGSYSNSNSLSSPLSEEKKRYLTEYYTRKAAEDEAYRHPKPNNSQRAGGSRMNNSSGGGSSGSANLRVLQTPLMEDKKQMLIDHFTRKAAAEGANNSTSQSTDSDTFRPDLPPKHSRNGRPVVNRNNDANSDPVDELLAWMPDTPTFV